MKGFLSTFFIFPFTRLSDVVETVIAISSKNAPATRIVTGSVDYADGGIFSQVRQLPIQQNIHHITQIWARSICLILKFSKSSIGVFQERIGTFSWTHCFVTQPLIRIICTYLVKTQKVSTLFRKEFRSSHWPFIIISTYAKLSETFDPLYVL